MTPDTVVRWHGQSWRLFWRRKSRSRGGRSYLSPEVRELIATMSRENRLWGTERIRSQLLKLGIVVSNRSIRRYRWREPARSPSQTWHTFLRNPAHHLWAATLTSRRCTYWCSSPTVGGTEVGFVRTSEIDQFAMHRSTRLLLQHFLEQRSTPHFA